MTTTKKHSVSANTTKPPTWQARVTKAIATMFGRTSTVADYARANRATVERAVRGTDARGSPVANGAGARVVVNLSSAHVPAFCEAAARRDAKPYKNCYDLALLGGSQPSLSLETVDSALPLPAKTAPAAVYFGAIEIAGTGMRYYGDICLVLARHAIPDNTVVLDRNSYDVLRAPVCASIMAVAPASQQMARRHVLKGWSGTWARDAGAMAALKALATIGTSGRLWTASQISQAVRDDEDYLEVLMARSFGPEQLQEARLATADAAHDAWVGGRMTQRPRPRLESLIYRQRRRLAEAALRVAGVPLRLVTTTGRTRD